MTGILPAHADKGFCFIIPGRNVIILKWPVSAMTVAGLTFKIMMRKTQGITAPVIGPATQHPRPPPEKFGIICSRVRLVRYGPATIYGSVVVAKIFIHIPRAHQRRITGSFKHGGFCTGVIITASLKQQHFDALPG